MNKTGAASQTKFSILTYGDNYTHLSPIELAADFTFSSLQRFGEQFIADYIDARRLPINILQKVCFRLFSYLYVCVCIVCTDKEKKSPGIHLRILMDMMLNHFYFFSKYNPIFHFYSKLIESN